MKKSFVHIYTGNGKGKTTAALGLIVRALGQEKKVCLIQLTWGQTNAIVDPLCGLDLSAFLAVLARTPLIFHANFPSSL